MIEKPFKSLAADILEDVILVILPKVLDDFSFPKRFFVVTFTVAVLFTEVAVTFSVDELFGITRDLSKGDS